MDKGFLEIKKANLNDLMQSVFTESVCKDETVAFMETDAEKTLLFPIESIISVTSYDGETAYREGVDFAVVNGNLVLLEGSSIPRMSLERYYHHTNTSLRTMWNGVETPTLWGEGELSPYQVKVTYRHGQKWDGFLQESYSEIYADFIRKLQNGENVTVFFAGDSITLGASASWIMGTKPYQLSYPILFVQALADLFGYTVHFEPANLEKTASVPKNDHVAGDRGIITYVNTGVGGWNSVQGVEHSNEYIVDKAKAYGCDLFVIGYGMNDVGHAPAVTRANVKAMADAALNVAPHAAIAILATMVPNPAGIGWYGNQYKQEPELLGLAEEYRQAGVACGVCRMTSISLSVLKRKIFHDYSGNNINHPNDFFVRLYAQAMLQTVIGYENIK